MALDVLQLLAFPLQALVPSLLLGGGELVLTSRSRFSLAHQAPRCVARCPAAVGISTAGTRAIAASSSTANSC
jgi:hypothetical protein